MATSSPPSAQNRPARVMSMPIRIADRNATSGLSRPKPLSMYVVKTFRNWSMTATPFILFLGRRRGGVLLSRPRLALSLRKHLNLAGPVVRGRREEPRAALLVGCLASCVGCGLLMERFAPHELFGQRIGDRRR